MTTHYSHLDNSAFQAIANGTKTIESRLFDEKRQLINVGDEIIFENRNDSTQRITTQVIALHIFPTFHELFNANNPSKFGAKTIDELDSQIKKIYSKQEQENFGTVGIEFKVLK